ncbi:F0F1 ATP synthase subunit gamma [Arenibacterium sp. CAU 1754]
MESLESISAKRATTDEVRAIVRTMKALSAASIHSYERAREAVSEYENTIALGLQILLRGSTRPQFPRPAAKGRPALIVIGSDRGLCGRFNDRITGQAIETLAQMAANGDNPFLAVSGLRAATRLEAAGHVIDHFFDLPGSVTGLSETVRTMTQASEAWFTQGTVSSVSIAFNRRGPEGMALPRVRTLFPVSDAYLDDLARRPWISRSLPMYRMDRDALFSWLIEQHLFVVLYRALADSLASEHASRLAAMKSAEKNIEERRDALTSQYRHTRQETITRELLDVIAGYETTHGEG